MSRSAVASIVAALLLAPAWASAQTGSPKVPGTGKLPGTGKVPGSSSPPPANKPAPSAGVGKIPGSAPTTGPWSKPAPMPPVFVVGNPYSWGGGVPVNPIIGEMTSGYSFPVAGNGSAFIGTRQPYVIGAPTVYGGPAFIQLPRFSEASIYGGTGGGVVTSGAYGRDSFGGRSSGEFGGGTSIGPGGVSGFNSFFNSGISLGLNGLHNLGKDNFLQWQAGPQTGGGPGATTVKGKTGPVGFNITGGQAAGFGRSTTAFVGGGQVVEFGGAPAEPPASIHGGRRPTAKEVDRLRSPPEMTWFVQEMWKSPGSQAHFNALGLNNSQRVQLFGYTLELIRTSLSDFQPARLPDGSVLQLQTRKMLVLTSADGKTRTGWLEDQPMPDAFEAVALHFYKSAMPARGL